MQSRILDWPEWADRTPASERDRPEKFDYGWNQTKSDLSSLFGTMGVGRWGIDHVTGSSSDPGVIVRWAEDGTDYAVACDAYTQKGGNLREAFLWIKFERRQGNRPVKTGRDQFAAAELPSGGEDIVVAGEDPPHEVLGVAPDASDAEVNRAFRELSKEKHTDVGGSAEEFKNIKRAKELMLGEV